MKKNLIISSAKNKIKLENVVIDFCVSLCNKNFFKFDNWPTKEN